MKWFDILKVLGTKSGFSQLDFDNIVIEDDDDCKKRWKELMDKIRNPTGIDAKYKILKGGTLVYLDEKDLDINIISVEYEFDETIPEEVYCKALEMLKITYESDVKDMGEYRIEFYNLPELTSAALEGALFSLAIYTEGIFGDPSAELTIYADERGKTRMAKVWEQLRDLLI